MSICVFDLDDARTKAGFSMSVSSIRFLLISQIWINQCLTKLITKKEKKNQIKNINFQKKIKAKAIRMFSLEDICSFIDLLVIFALVIE